jgi:hypothetical protein
METIKEQIQEMVNRETRTWNKKDAETLVSIFHPLETTLTNFSEL